MTNWMEEAGSEKSSHTKYSVVLSSVKDYDLFHPIPTSLFDRQFEQVDNVKGFFKSKPE